MTKRKADIRPGFRPGQRYDTLDPARYGGSPQIKVHIKESTRTRIDAEARRQLTTRSELVRTILEREFPDE